MSEILMATRRQARELVDGTIEVKLHIEPRYKASFHALFPEIDMPVALAPLNLKASTAIAQEETIAKERLTGLALLAVQWCQEPKFWEWLNIEHESNSNIKETTAKNHICYNCQISSRKELNTNTQAAAIFQQEIRAPYMQWLRDEGVIL